MSQPGAGMDRASELLARYRRIIGEGSWVLAGQAMTGIFTLAGTRLVTQWVAPELYGLVNLAQNALILLRTLFCSPLLNSALRYYPDADRFGYLPAFRLWLRQAILKLMLGMEICVIAGGLYWTWRTGAPTGVIPIMMAFTAFDVWRTARMTLFSAARLQRPAALAGAAETLIRPLLMVAAVLVFGASLQSLLGAIAASIGLTLLGLRLTAGNELTDGGSVLPPGMSAEMVRYALPLVPIALLNWTTSLSDRYLIQWLSHDPQSVGIYAAGYGLVSQSFLILHTAISLTLRPVYFGAISRNEPAHAIRTFRTWLVLATMLCLGATAFTFLERKLLVGLLLGPRYHDAVVVVPWIALGYFFYVIEQVMEQHLLAHKRTGAVLVAQICGAVGSVAATIPLVLRFGMVGAAYACPVYFLLQFLVATVLVAARKRPPPAVT